MAIDWRASSKDELERAYPDLFPFSKTMVVVMYVDDWYTFMGLNGDEYAAPDFFNYAMEMADNHPDKYKAWCAKHRILGNLR